LTELLQIVSRLEQSGGTLFLDGDRIRYSVPKGSHEAQQWLAELRKHRTGVKELLRQRANEPGEKWPPESFEAERRFGQPHAKLFLLIGRKVRTPSGPGTLLQVFAHRVTVLLDSELNKCNVFTPGEIAPVSGDWQQ
jgi:hypothetical protein